MGTLWSRVPVEYRAVTGSLRARLRRPYAQRGRQPVWHDVRHGRGVDEALRTLEHEFRNEPGSFLLRLRCDLFWDRDAFTRLERSMRAVCEGMQAAEELPRWLVEGYYQVATEVHGWTSHPDFPRPGPGAYHDACVERLCDLADWFFHGRHAYLEPHTWPEL